MSAYIVRKRVIGYLIGNDQFLEHNQGYFNRDQLPVDTGRMLWEENLKSVQHRYDACPADELPGALAEFREGFKQEDILNITPESFDPVQLLKTIAHLEYQSCEHSEWEDSTACKYLEQLQRRTLRALPGWSEAAWGAPDEDVEPEDPDQQKKYRVTWEIDIDARTAIAAAREARKAQEPDSTAVVFRCQALGTMPTVVDLQGVLGDEA